MNIQFKSSSNLPICIIDQFYSDGQEKRIWQELDFLSNDQFKKLKSEEETSPATDSSGQLLKKNRGIWIDEVYNQRHCSNILVENRQLFDSGLLEILENHHIFFKYISISSSDVTLLQHYSNSEYYLPHFDFSLITAITWFYRMPKSFRGGDLIIGDVKIDCLHNRMVILPSILSHQVTEMDMDVSDYFGRYSITQFLHV